MGGPPTGSIAAVNEATELTFADAMAFWTERVGGEVYRFPSMVRFAMGTRVPSQNGVVGTRLPIAAVDEQIAETTDFFRTRGLPWSWRVASGTIPEGMEQHLLPHGFRLAEEFPRFAVQLETARSDQLAVKGFEIRAVANAQASELWARTLLEGSPMDEAWTHTMLLLARAVPLDGPWVRFIGFHEGQPVATSGLLLFGRIAGVVHVCTIGEARRRGFAEAMTAKALHYSQQRGYKVAVLGSSAMAQPLYERMGFRQIGWIRSYVMHQEDRASGGERRPALKGPAWGAPG